MGCKGYRKESILEVLDHLDHWTGYTFEAFLFLHLQRKKIAQVGIDCEDTRTSRFNLLHEGYYRFRHLYQMKKRLQTSPFWSGISQKRIDKARNE
jgi:hypothetical protein